MGDDVSRWNLPAITSRARRPLACLRAISSRASVMAARIPAPPFMSARADESGTILPSREFLARARVVARSTSGSTLNWGSAATRNRLTSSPSAMTTLRQASRSRTSGVSLTSMFSMRNGTSASTSSRTDAGDKALRSRSTDGGISCAGS